MSETSFFRALERDARELENIANQYAKGSPQYEAIKHATFALLYVVMNKQEEFASFLKIMAQDLSDVERQQLRAYGLED